MMLVKAKFYRPELDILRFVAFGLVFIFHAAASIHGEMTAAGGIQAFVAKASVAGAYGVDIFFLLSSYLIAELFVREMASSKRIDVSAFYIRRILRIWPLYFFFVTITIVLSRFSPVQFPHRAVIPMLLFYGNFWIASNGFFSPAGILWSVSVEEQFYILCPLAMRFLSRNGMIIFCGCLLLSASVARFVFYSQAIITPNGLWYCTLTRLDPIAGGILVCLLLRGRVPVFGTALRCAFIAIGTACLGAAATWLLGVDEKLSLASAMMAYPLATVGALAIFFAFLGARLTWRPAVYLGRISYGLYVFHLLALNIAKAGLLHFTGECSFWLRALIAFPITVALAAGSYAWLETPFLRLKGRVSRPRAPVLATHPGNGVMPLV